MESQSPLDAALINGVSRLETPGTALYQTRGGKEFDWSQISQTIVRLDWALLHPSTATVEVSQSLFEPWERLVKILAELRSPSSGWPSHLPQTPENLAPYVIEEAGEVLDAIHTEIGSQINKSNFPAVVPGYGGKVENILPPQQFPHYLRVEDLIPRLLWYIARSSDDVMRLLAGVKARALQPGQDWSSGTLRLAAILTVSSATPWSIDLVTKQSPGSDELWGALRLLPEALIVSNDGYFCRGSHQCESLLQELKYKIQQATPEITLLTELLSLDLLEPGKNWQSGQVTLKFYFEFLADDPDEEVVEPILREKQELTSEGWEIEVEKSGLEGRQRSRFISQSPLLLSAALEVFPPEIEGDGEPFKLNEFIWKSSVRLTDKAFFNQYLEFLSKQHLSSLVFELREIYKKCGNFGTFLSNDEFSMEDLSWGESAEISGNVEFEEMKNHFQSSIKQLKSYSLVLRLVRSASLVVDAVENPEAWNQANWVEPQFAIADLTLKLLWQIIRSSYDVMQLVGGIKARVLQPGCDWETGTLRLMLIFQGSAAELAREIDVAAGQLLKPNTRWVASKAIVQSDESGFCQEPVEAGNLLIAIIGQLEKTSPEIGLWIKGTGVDWQLNVVDNSLGLGVDYTSWKAGLAQLSLKLEWMAEDSLVK